MLLHTTGRTGTVVVSGMARADGLVGTARGEWAGGSQGRVETVWTDSTALVQRFVVAPGTGGLRVTGSRDTEVSLPAGMRWAVAEFGMEEQVVPALAGIAPGAMLALYHPYPNTLEIVTVRVRPLAGGRLYVLVKGSEATVLVVDDAGDLLGVGYSTGLGERAPAPGTARRARADRLFEQVRASRAPNPG